MCDTDTWLKHVVDVSVEQLLGGVHITHAHIMYTLLLLTVRLLIAYSVHILYEI